MVVTLSDLPTDLLLDTLLPALDVQSLVSLGSTSKQWHALTLGSSSATADSLWRAKLLRDKNFPVQNTARSDGWLDVYKALTYPEVYVFGSAANGRLGFSEAELRRQPSSIRGALDVPTRLHVPKGTSIVQCSAGGWSFHALDSKGRVWCWGTLDGSGWAAAGQPYTNPFKQQSTPMLLQADFARRVTHVDSGRAHAVALDEAGHVYEWRSWGRVARIQSSERVWSTALQVSAGWSFTCILAAPEAGQPHHKRLFVHFEPRATAISRAATAQQPVIASEGYEQPTVTFDLDVDSLQLPPVPFQTADEDVSKIATGDLFVLVLSTAGRVYKLDIHPIVNPGLLDRRFRDEESEGMPPRLRERLAAAFLSGERRWQYLERFCDGSRLSQNQELRGIEGIEQLRMTHISAHFQRFAVYCASARHPEQSVVLIGDKEADTDTTPSIIPELQGRGIIKILQGDYHYGAISYDGKLLTWGNYSDGAVGHSLYNSQSPLYMGDQERGAGRPNPQPLSTPAEVCLGAKSQASGHKFVFDGAFAGWHSCVLAVDMSARAGDAEESDNEEERSDMPGTFREVPTEHMNEPPTATRGRGAPGPGRVLRGGHRPFMPLGIRRGYPLRGARGN